VTRASGSRSDEQRLQQIAAERGSMTPDTSYRIGPGDLIEVTVFDLQEMNRKVRVESNGGIQLPLVGAVTVAGKSEADIAHEIASRLSTFVRSPQVTVFVQEYKSQQVAVTGSVAKPGLYPLTRERRTIIDMISEGGGLTRDAGALVEFIPARPGDSLRAAPSPDAVRNDPRGIYIELAELMRGGNGGANNVPVMPGDVIYVPRPAPSRSRAGSTSRELIRSHATRRCSPRSRRVADRCCRRSWSASSCSATARIRAPGAP